MTTWTEQGGVGGPKSDEKLSTWCMDCPYLNKTKAFTKLVS